MDEMLDELMPSWEKIAKGFDIVLLDTCSIEGYNRGGTMLGYLYDDSTQEESLKGLKSYKDRYEVVGLVIEAYDSICTIPEVSKELDRLYVYFRRNFNQLIRLPDEIKERFSDFSERIRVLRRIIQDIRDSRRLSERHAVRDPDYERFADLFYEASKAADTDFGVTDNRLAARAIYENLKGKKAAIITDDGDQRYIMKAAYPFLLGAAPESAKEKMQKHYTQVFMPDRDTGLRYDLGYSTTYLTRPNVPESAAAHAAEMRELMGRIAS
jgi:hypothetical protein